MSTTVGVGACVGALPVDETRGTDKVVDDYIHDKLSELGYGEWYLTNEGLMPDIHMNLEDDDCWDDQRITPSMEMYGMSTNIHNLIYLNLASLKKIFDVDITS